MQKSKQLALSLKRLIETGTWKAHDKLPSLRQQVQISGFSLMTVLNAYQELEAQGLIYSKSKLGYFVAVPPVPASGTHNMVQSTNIEINSRVFRYLKSIQSEHIVPFGSAFPDSRLLYSAQLMHTLARQAKHKAAYQQMPSLPPGNYALRKYIAQRYCMQGIPTDPEDIVITSGGLDALNLSLRALTQAGDYILLQESIFYGAWQAAENLGLNVIILPDHPEYGLDLEAFKQALITYPIKVCLLMLNSQNPIGFTVCDEIKAQLAALLYEHDVYLIEDDVYEELYYGVHKPHSMKFFDRHHRVIHCSSFSKTLGAGFRVGWVYAAQFSAQIQHLQLMSTISVNALIQSTLVEYLSQRHYDKHLKQLRSSLKRLKDQYYEILTQRLPATCHIHYYPSGYFLWIALPERLDSQELYQDLLQHQIGIAPGYLFNQRPEHAHHLRLNCSFEIDVTIEQALQQLAQSIKRQFALNSMHIPKSDNP